jgi:succinate dehydrogenase / fumarate reductase, cytochrome b subunit
MIRRPLSPHLQIYKLPLAAIISISHRIIGAALFIAAMAAAIYCLLVLSNINLLWIDDLMFSWLGNVKISFLVAALFFYGLAECRYIIWGFNCGFSLFFIRLSNFLIIIIALILSIINWFVIWG